MAAPKHTALFDLTRVYDRDDLTLNGSKLSVALGDAAQHIPVERTMEGASTLTVQVIDPGHALLAETELLGRKQLKKGITLSVDTLPFRLMEVEKRRHGLDLIFYDEPTSRLKLKHGAIKASRGKMTRPEMVAWACRLAGTGSYIPEIKDRPVIADLDDASAKELRRVKDAAPSKQALRDSRAKGVLKTAKGLTVKGKAATSEQRRAMERVQAQCDEEDAPPKARLAATLAPIGESSYLIGATEQVYGTHHGLYQSNVIPASDVEGQVHSFLHGGRSFLAGGAIGLAKSQPGLSVGEIVSKVEISDGNGAFYDKYRDEAVRIVDAWQPGSGSGLSADSTRTGSADRAYQETYEFVVAADEDYLEATVRLAEEVRWRLFSNGNQIVYATDLKLLEAPVAVVLEEGKNGCDEINWTWTARERIDELDATIRLAKWAAPPGSRVLVRGEGPANGDHLVRTIGRDLLDASASAAVTLGRPQAPLPEPASEVRTVQGTAAAADEIDQSGGSSRKGDKRGKWIYGPGVPKTLNAKMQSFLDRAATFYSGTLIVTTSTNHARLASSGNVSDHREGGAADFGSVANWDGKLDGEGGFKIAIAFYQACGLSYKQARAKAQVPSYDRVPCKESGRGVQILWRVDGHHDHVHAGIGP